MPEAAQNLPEVEPQAQESAQELKFKNSRADWALRFLIFVVFLYFGTAKLNIGPDAPWFVLFDQIGLGQWFRYFTAAIEILGASLVLVSGAVEIGLGLLFFTMFGALMISVLVLHQSSEIFFPFTFMCGLLALFLHRRRV